MKTLGVDISENNGSVNFAELKQAGVKFVLIRCGYGDDVHDQDDSRFFENIRKAKEYGLPYGVYFYSYALNTENSRSEARHALRLLEQIDKPAYGVWFDMEDADGYKAKHGMPSDSMLRTICEIFCTMLQEAGYYTGIYAAVSWLNNQLAGPQLDRFDKWAAQWNVVCEYKKTYSIWQFTDKMIIGGEEFDANYAYKEPPYLLEGDDQMLSYEQWKEYQARYEKEQAEKAAAKWAEPALDYCKEQGLMVGDKDGSMRPCSSVTRQELAQVIYNLESKKA